MSIRAFAAISARAISCSPPSAAQRRGVEPSPDLTLTSAPCLKSARTGWRSPAFTAFVSALSPAPTTTATITAVATKHAVAARSTRVINALPIDAEIQPIDRAVQTEGRQWLMPILCGFWLRAGMVSREAKKARKRRGRVGLDERTDLPARGVHQRLVIRLRNRPLGVTAGDNEPVLVVVPVGPDHLAFERFAGADGQGEDRPRFRDAFQVHFRAEPDIAVRDRFGDILPFFADAQRRNPQANLDRMGH